MYHRHAYLRKGWAIQLSLILLILSKNINVIGKFSV
ncbi:MAG: hypothetical protein JWL77_2208 [Chthonomonadaceae bacterium]|nr:hypothetical protein [Chthonomonadaceae bacterium]